MPNQYDANAKFGGPQNTALKSSWVNGIIGAAIILVVGMALRIALWHFRINLQDDLFLLEFISNSLWLLVFVPIIPVACSLISYNGWVGLAANNPARLPQVSRGDFGKPWIIPMIVNVVLEVVWNIICVIIMFIAWGLDPAAYPEDGSFLLTFLAIAGLGLLVDVVTYLLSERFFAPDTIMSNR